MHIVMTIRDQRFLRATNRAFILILTLWVLVILSLIALSFAHRVVLYTKIAKYHVDSLEAKANATAMFHLLCSEIIEDTNDYDAYSDAWGKAHSIRDLETVSPGVGTPRQAEAMQVKGWVVDEQGKINLNTAAMATIKRVLEYEDFNFTDPNAVAENLVSWRIGTGRGFYIPDKGFSGTKGHPYSSINEILWFPEITLKDFYGEDANANGRLDPNEDDSDVAAPPDNADDTLQGGLIDYFTISSNGKININTAPKAVLLTLPMMNETKVDDLIRRRAGLDGIEGTEDDNPFKTVEEIMDLSSISSVRDLEFNHLSPLITVKSDAFTIIAECYVPQTGLMKRIAAVVLRNGDSLKCLSWKEE
jgi:hypothetical protein